MDIRIVVLGAGRSGTLAANLLRRHFGDGAGRIVVIDRNDTRDPETELLKAIGLYGPHALNGPEHLQLRDGIEFRHVEAASVDQARDEVCLMDGTTAGYDVLVIATGATPLPRPGDSAPNVFAVGAAGTRSVRGPAVAEAEELVHEVRAYLSGAAPGSGDSTAPASRGPNGPAASPGRPLRRAVGLRERGRDTHR